MEKEYCLYVNRSSSVPSYLDRNLRPQVRTALAAAVRNMRPDMPLKYNLGADGVFNLETFLVDTPGEDLIDVYSDSSLPGSTIVNWNYVALMTVVCFTGDADQHLTLLSECSNQINAAQAMRQFSDIQAPEQLVGYYNKSRLVESILTDLNSRPKNRHKPRYEVVTLAEAKELLKNYKDRKETQDVLGAGTHRWLTPA